MIDPKLLEILACPVCPDRPALRLSDGLLVCPAGHRFPIVDGIPHLVADEMVSDEKKEDE